MMYFSLHATTATIIPCQGFGARERERGSGGEGWGNNIRRTDPINPY